VRLKLSGRDEKGEPFSILTTTENISRSSFLCSGGVALPANSTVRVHLLGSTEEEAGMGRVVRWEWAETSYPRYAFRFIDKVNHWVLE
jgi:hypothetical protein